MRTKRIESWSWRKEVLPFVAMLLITCSDIGVLTIVKGAMNRGMKSIVYVVYHDALGTLILLPFFLIHIFRNNGVERPSLSFHLLFKFFTLGLLGICLSQILIIKGTYYSSPTMVSAISNLVPAFTFLLAVVFRMERIDIRSASSLAKLSGTIIAISGAMLFTFYQGPEVLHTTGWPDSSNRLLLSQPSNWILGGLMLVVAVTFIAIFRVLQSAIAREYSDQRTIVFFVCLFGTMQCIALSPLLESNPSAWLLQPGSGMLVVVLGAVLSVVIHNSVILWCLEKKGPVFVSMFYPLSIVISVIMGVTFLGDSLHLGSIIGAIIISCGFYIVMWGQAKEKNMISDDIDVANEPGLSDQTIIHLLSSRNESKC